MMIFDNCSHKFVEAFLLSGTYWIGGDGNEPETNEKTISNGQKACPQTVLQLCGRQLPFARQRRTLPLCAAQFHLRNLLQILAYGSTSRGERAIRRNPTAEPCITTAHAFAGEVCPII